jgi:hypothetical protein
MQLMLPLPALVLLLAALPTPPASARTAPVRTLTVTARNYAYEMPDTVAAGRTEFRLLNKGTEMHHVSLIRLDGGRTVADFLAAVKAGGPPPAWAHDEGGPNTPVPGGTSVAIVDLKPGNYLTVCWIPSNDGVPHVMKGMIRGFTVVDPSRVKAVAKASAAADGALPDGAIKNVPVSDVTLTLNDYSFTFSKPLSAGKHMLRIENAAKQAHEIFIVRLAPGKSAKDVAAWVEKQSGPPPAEPLGGISSMSAGRVNEIPLDLAPGNYGLLCFIPDAKDGKPHVAHGMMQDIVVK